MTNGRLFSWSKAFIKLERESSNGTGDSCHFYRRPHGVCATQNLSQSLLISLQLEIFAFTHHNTLL